MNQPQYFIGSVSEQFPYSSKYSFRGKYARFFESGTFTPFARVCARGFVKGTSKNW